MRKSTWEMLGEFLREASVLVLVFALLEPIALGRPMPWPQIGWVAFFVTIGLAGGIGIERRRELTPESTEEKEV